MLERAGFSLARLRQLATTGLKLEAHTDQTISSVELTSIAPVDEMLLDRHKGRREIERSLSHSYEQFILEDLIDSLKEHAIITSVR